MADLTCGAGGSNGNQIVTQINTNTANIAKICIWHSLECDIGLSQHKCPNSARVFRRGLN